jgi:hypothetical protein
LNIVQNTLKTNLKTNNSLERHTANALLAGKKNRRLAVEKARRRISTPILSL